MSISRNYTTLGGTHKWASRWCNQLTAELPRKKHSGMPVCHICQIGKFHGFETWRVSKPYSCVFFSSSLRTCLSTSKSHRLYFFWRTEEFIPLMSSLYGRRDPAGAAAIEISTALVIYWILVSDVPDNNKAGTKIPNVPSMLRWGRPFPNP